MTADEKLQAKMFLEMPDVAADRGLGDVKLLRGLGEAEPACGYFESANCGKRWQAGPCADLENPSGEESGCFSPPKLDA